MLHDDIKASIKDAMRAKDEVRLRTLRGILAAFTNELVATKRTPQEMLPNEDGIAVIRRLVKQRKDSIDQFEKGGRQDLVEGEKAEMSILEKYLPQLMPRADIQILAEAKKAELNISDKSKAGILTGALMKDLKGKADGADVKAVVDSLFA
ncbi:MAG: GatB/YqeY domain-containing protein [Candidatus Paceibacterota bacterium]|jgi:hypothetical protein